MGLRKSELGSAGEGLGNDHIVEKVPTLSMPRRWTQALRVDRQQQELFRFLSNDACNVLRRELF
jgi:hypothetical protein